MTNEMSVEDALKVASEATTEPHENLIAALEVLAGEVKMFREREPKLQAALDNMAPRIPELDQFRNK